MGIFLKTQDDLDRLLLNYPIDKFYIKIAEGERKNFFGSDKKSFLVIYYADQSSIRQDGKSIILEQIDFFGDHFQYGYSLEGIKVISIFKKLSYLENPNINKTPVYINDFLIPINKRKEVTELYIVIEKFKVFLNLKRDEFLIAKNTDFDETKLTNQTKDFMTYFVYQHQSFSSYFGTLSRKLLDNRDDVTSIHRILTAGLDLGIVSLEKYSIYMLELATFSIPKRNINKLITHIDDKEFLDFVRIKRTSDNTGSINMSGLNSGYFIKNLDRVFEFIHRVLLQEFGITIWDPKNIPSQKYTLSFDPI